MSTIPPIIAAAHAALRAIDPTQTRWAIDALLQLSAAATEAEIVARSVHHHGHAEGQRAIAKECRRLAAEAEARAARLSQLPENPR